MAAAGILRFVHLLVAMGLFGTVIAGWLVPVRQLKKRLLATGMVAALTGTLLIQPGHYTLHTPWIQAAYLLLGIFLLLVFVCAPDTAHQKKSVRYFVWRALGPVLVLILAGIVHDAVMKSTLFF